MKATIEVKDRGEAAAVKAGLDDPVIRAATLISGALAALPSDRARRRVLDFVTAGMADDHDPTRTEGC